LEDIEPITVAAYVEQHSGSPATINQHMSEFFAPKAKRRPSARQGQRPWHGVRWDGKTATSFPLNETDETPLLQHPLEEAASPSDREIDANQKHVMSAHDKNLFIEQRKDGYAILSGGVKKPVAIESTQDAAIEKARKLGPDAAIHVERVRNVEGGGRDKWRRIWACSWPPRRSSRSLF
jgi:hypothetical protein